MVSRSNNIIKIVMLGEGKFSNINENFIFKN